MTRKTRWYAVRVPDSSDDKESTCHVGDLGSIPGLGRSLEEGMGTHSSALAWRIPVGRGAWRAAVPGVAQGQTRVHDRGTGHGTHSVCDGRGRGDEKMKGKERGGPPV